MPGYSASMELGKIFDGIEQQVAESLKASSRGVTFRVEPHNDPRLQEMAVEIAGRNFNVELYGELPKSTYVDGWMKGWVPVSTNRIPPEYAERAYHSARELVRYGIQRNIVDLYSSILRDFIEVFEENYLPITQWYVTHREIPLNGAVLKGHITPSEFEREVIRTMADLSKHILRIKVSNPAFLYSNN
ncbi:hypothetical protein HYU14_04830 [Candidatus Woesearchaeota archaeon]|nr:hypothetical protein [Candidatus Woesearchaeota archaeon]